ncbi:MAG: UDP-2,3-diacylglucosamine diphosphatase LpxI, partial [Desulfobacterales bacterium]|nr:UDP-2,3-diacylglucosamine diphosphatase LpxI [Desulfobacterales bacterium]
KMRGDTHDDRVLRAFAGLLEDEGIKVRPSTFMLPELLSEPGCWTRRKPSEKERRDIALGWKMAKAIGGLDIGQCVVVGNGSVLAVEAIDGTDSTIRRGGGLGRGDAVVVKVCKPIQDFRFDVPAVGSRTIRTMHEFGARVLVIEAGRSIVFDREEMVALADDSGVVIEACRDADFDFNEAADQT